MMELLVVLAIIGNIVIRALPNFMGVVYDAKKSSGGRTAITLKTALKTRF